MDFDLRLYEEIYRAENFKSSGLTQKQLEYTRAKYGVNTIEKTNKKSTLKRIVNALFEPMVLILLFAFTVTFAVNITNLFCGREADFYECIGIFISIFLSIALTVIMENKSEKAFELLESYSKNTLVKVIRDNHDKIINCTEVCVGDVIVYEAGDKIVADAVVIECADLQTEEATLNGEARLMVKNAYKNGKFSGENVLFSSTYIKSGYAKCIVLAVGKDAQAGKIAVSLEQDLSISAPLSQKLSDLSKKISIFGGVSAAIVFILSILRQYLLSSISFTSVRDAFIDAIVLIVAAVPEGLPVTVAISLTLSVVKLAKSSAIIKKLTATETVGCISVICCDKTGTLTTGEMSVNVFELENKRILANKLNNEFIKLNVAVNSTAICVNKNGKQTWEGNFTEQALLRALYGEKIEKLNDLRKENILLDRLPFSSKNKYMFTKIQRQNGEIITLYKGSLEKIIALSNLSEKEREILRERALFYEKNSERILAFAHDSGNGIIYDGFCSIIDEIRQDVIKSVHKCKKAGINVKILTGDNRETALAIAKKLGLSHSSENSITGAEIDLLSDAQLIKILGKINVIARSTPETKLRVVKLLKKQGEIVAVTGDGVNDSPAIKNADIGIAMGSGSDITKEAADIILLNNSFSVIVKAISFGRNIYRNFQRFIFFQLTVNFSAVALIISFLLLGFKSPFNAIQLLWINVIMDGPLALTLGLEGGDSDLLDEKPVRRSDAILNKKTLLRTVIHSIMIVGLILLQKLFNFLNLTLQKNDTAIFCMFVTLQIFNAINARELGNRGAVKTIGKNKVFLYAFFITLMLQIIITEFLRKMFNTVSLGLIPWIKILGICSLIVILSEAYKTVYRLIIRTKFYKKIIKRSKFA